MIQKSKGKYIAILIIIIFAIVITQEIEIVTGDLGRHIINGKFILTNPTLDNSNIFYENFYASNFKDADFVNHHWLTGVVFYLTYLIGDFPLLGLLRTLILTLMLIILFLDAKKESNYWFVSLISLPFIIIMLERTDIRPEIFSYLFIALYIFILKKIRQELIKSKKINKYTYVLFFLIQLIWANLHIYSFIGIYLSFALLIDILLTKEIKIQKKQKVISILKLISILVAASLINPNTIRGLLYPLNIFTNYGYDLVENMSPYFIYTLTINPKISIYFITLFLVLVTVLINYKEISLFEFLILLFCIASSLFSLRNIIVFAIMAMPIFIKYLYKNIKNNTKIIKITSIILIICFLVSSCYIAIDQKNVLITEKIGLNTKADSMKSIKFYKENNLTGPIFNNYDNGGYIIFNLFPKEKVFVDNRPEAYTVDFFQNTYIKMQQNETKWNEELEKDKFKIIYFSLNENTPWGNKFIKNRITDHKWIVVHIDKTSIILVKRKSHPELEKFTINKSNIISKINYLINSESTDDLLDAISILIKFNDYENAIRLLNKIIEKEPNNIYAYSQLASIYSSSNNINLLKQSVILYEKTIELGYKKSKIFNSLGYVYFQLKEYEKAKQTWEKSRSYNYNDETAKNYLDNLKTLDETYNLY